jgi:hypothetical protein
MAEPRNLDSQRPSEKPIEIGGTGKARTSLVSERNDLHGRPTLVLSSIAVMTVRCRRQD